jgi:hypothetical protein
MRKQYLCSSADPLVAFGWTFTREHDLIHDDCKRYSCTNRTAPNYGESVTDMTTPDPTKSLHGYMYPGTADAREPFMCFVPLPGTTRTYYFEYRFKYGNNWVTHPTLNKHMYFMTDSANHVGGFFGTRKRSDGIEQLLYAPASVFGQGYRYVNVGSPIAIQKNVWYKVSGTSMQVHRE